MEERYTEVQTEETAVQVETALQEKTTAQEETTVQEETAAQEKTAAKEQAAAKMVPVTSVRFRAAGKAYYFDPGDLTLSKGQHVIVETARGLEFGTVAVPLLHVSASKITPPLRMVVRAASKEDEEREALNREKEREAIRICKEKVALHGLEMKLIDAEYTFDNSKLLFYFTADGRVDFRDLVKDLAGVFRTRIELRQIGVRDETQRLGGYGSCGRPLCCHTWLTEFIPVSIKMAKEQNLSLNQGKISGVCGRLMCCLKNEVETYEELNKNLPRQGDEVEGNDGLTGIVESVNVLRQTIRILVDVNDEKELHEYGVGDFVITRRKRKGGSKAAAPRGGKEAAKENKEAGRESGKENGEGRGREKGRENRRRNRRRQPAEDAGTKEAEAQAPNA